MIDLQGFAFGWRVRSRPAVAVLAGVIVAVLASVALAAKPIKASSYRGHVKVSLGYTSATRFEKVGTHVKLIVSSSGNEGRLTVRMDYPVSGSCWPQSTTVFGIPIYSNGTFAKDFDQGVGAKEETGRVRGQFIRRRLVKVMLDSFGYKDQPCWFYGHGKLRLH